MSGRIIILHGPSSSGKSTMANAIQNLAEVPFWHISFDHLRDSGVLPNDRIERREFLWSELRKPVFDGFHGARAAYAKAGNNLIVEHILDTPEWVGDLKKLLSPFDVFFVGLHCSLKELHRREIERKDRPAGSAERDYRTVHLGRVYHIEIDGQIDPAHNARTILDLWNLGARHSEFAR